MLKNITIEEFINQNTITDSETIRKALCMPNSIPASFRFKELKPVGVAKFKGDKITIEAWSVNSHFTVDNIYPVYEREGEFIISEKTGEGMKITPKAWCVRYF